MGDSSLVWGFLVMICINCQKLDSFECFKVRNVRKRLNFGILLLFDNCLKNGLITFLYILYSSFLGMILINCQEMDLIRIIWKVIFKVGKVRFGPLSHRYYSVVTKCCPIVLHHVASLECNQSCSKIWRVWNHSHGHFKVRKVRMVHAMTNDSMKH